MLKLHRFELLFCIAAMLLLSVTAFAEESSMTISDVKNIVAVDNIAAYPNLNLLSDGTIVAFVYDQPSQERDEGEIVCYASTDGGKTWELRSQPLRHGPGPAPLHAAAGLGDDGMLIALFGGFDDEDYKKYQMPIAVCRSKDGGKTWVKDGSVMVPPDMPSLTPYGNIVKVKEGVLGVPMYAENFSDWRGGVSRSYFFFSYDNGKTWKDPALIGEPGHKPREFKLFISFNETHVLSLRPDRLLAVARRRLVNDCD